MGKTPKPLRILVTDSTMLGWDEIVKLQKLGHHVARLAGHWDLVLGPNCRSMNEQLRAIFSLDIKEARARAYPGK